MQLHYYVQGVPYLIVDFSTAGNFRNSKFPHIIFEIRDDATLIFLGIFYSEIVKNYAHGYGTPCI